MDVCYSYKIISEIPFKFKFLRLIRTMLFLLPTTSYLRLGLSKIKTSDNL